MGAYMFCTNCGNKIEDGESFCNKCGEENRFRNITVGNDSVNGATLSGTSVDDYSYMPQKKRSSLYVVCIVIAVLVFSFGIIYYFASKSKGDNNTVSEGEEKAVGEETDTKYILKPVEDFPTLDSDDENIEETTELKEETTQAEEDEEIIVRISNCYSDSFEDESCDHWNYENLNMSQDSFFHFDVEIEPSNASVNLKYKVYYPDGDVEEKADNKVCDGDRYWISTSMSNPSKDIEGEEKVELINQETDEVLYTFKVNLYYNPDELIYVSDDCYCLSDEKIPFYGVFCYASEDEDDATEYCMGLWDKGYYVSWEMSSDWSNLNQEDYYVVSLGRYESEERAEEVLDYFKDEYPDAYIKYSGDYIGD